MATQLILYPQNYKGEYSFNATPIITNYVGDSFFWNNYNSFVVRNCATSPSNAGLDAVENAHAFAGGWRTFRTDGTQASTTQASIPVNNGAGIELECNASSTDSSAGIYQKITGLQIGGTYTLTAKVITASFSGFLCFLGVPNTATGSYTQSNGVSLGSLGNVLTASFFVNGTTGTITQSITADASEETLMIALVGNSGDKIVIESITLEEAGSTVPYDYTEFADGQVICDLYKDEIIPLTLSVDNFVNAGEKITSYSKSFQLPATKRNNKIFSSIFEITRTSRDYAFMFNPYVKTQAVLKEDSYIIFEGFLKLSEIIEKEGETSYSVNLHSSPTTLKDILSTLKIRDMTLSELDHEYTADNIRASWTGALALTNPLPTGSKAGSGSTTGVLKYPFVDWTGNLSQSGDTINLTSLEQAFRPFIKCKYLLDTMFRDAGFSYTSTFLNTNTFKKLFMDFNWGEGNGLGVQGNYQFNAERSALSANQFLGTSYSNFDTNTVYSAGGVTFWNTSTDKLTSVSQNMTIDVVYNIKLRNNSTGSRGYDIHFLHEDGAGTDIKKYDPKSDRIAGAFPSGGKTQIYSGSFNLTMNTGDTLRVRARAATANKILYDPYVNNWMVFTLTNEGGLSLSQLLKKGRGDLTQWDFFKGIIEMFNLVLIEDKENPQNLFIEPYADIFEKPIHPLNTTGSTSSSKRHVWTEKVDVSEIKLKPIPELVRQTNFTYEKDEPDYGLKYYAEQSNGYLYGSKIFIEEDMTLLAGEKTITAKPFAPTLIRPPLDTFDSDLCVPSIYTANAELTEFKDFQNKPRILYDLGVKTIGGNDGYSIPASQNSTSASNIFTDEQDFLQFAHVNAQPTVSSTTFDYNFQSGGLIQPMGLAPVDNLFSVYWSPYYDELYHPDTRVMILKVNLTPADIHSFRFYDTVLIKNAEYRVNKINYKTGELAVVEFILLP